MNIILRWGPLTSSVIKLDKATQEYRMPFLPRFNYNPTAPIDTCPVVKTAVFRLTGETVRIHGEKVYFFELEKI